MIRDLTSSDIIYLIGSTRWTILLFVIAVCGGASLGLVVTLFRISGNRILRGIAIVYINLIQGTPLLIQLFLAFFLPNIIGVHLDPLGAASLALSINASAFLAEIWRGSLSSIGRGQWEAATALGLRYLPALFLVILPQAVRLSIPPTVGYLVQLLKATALASVIGFVDLTRAGQLLINATGQPMLILLIIAAVYFCLCWPLSLLSRRLEAKLLSRR